MAKHKFKFLNQLNAMDCGPTCLAMICDFHGRNIPVSELRDLTGMSKEGVSLLGISEVAEKVGLRTRGVVLTFEQLTMEINLPSILHWGQNHFVVLLPGSKINSIRIADPSKGMIKYSANEFKKNWHSQISDEGEPAGIALLIEPTTEFFEKDQSIAVAGEWKLVFQYLSQAKKQIVKIIITMIFVATFQLIIPFLTQSIVDTGIQTKNLQYITILLIAQLIFVFSRSFADFIRSRILLRISVKINFSLLSDFWIKLSKLPLNYFDRYHTGDTIQRLNDSKKIENFFTGNLLNTLVSIFTFGAFALVLCFYQVQIFIVFIIGSILYFLWIRFFLSFRRKINVQTFKLTATENNMSFQMIQGMQELRLNGADQKKRWEWENVQSAIYNLNFKTLSYSQLQQIGALFINEGKNLLITFMVAQLVINGNLTIGAMMAIQYITGQLSSPVEQFIGFVQSGQDAKISLERLNDIHKLKNENELFLSHGSGITILPEDKTITVSNLRFSYPGNANKTVLKDLSFSIPGGKTTALVGTSGSGKTTLVKILLKFYDQYDGAVKVGPTQLGENMSSTISNFRDINPDFWRSKCGSVLQDGMIFNDSVKGNIALSHESGEVNSLKNSCMIANIHEFVNGLPNGFNTKLGTDGLSMSQGQKQRILIARAVYRNPEYLFFDEATNALDANTEKVIVDNLENFFQGRTVVVVAHRLSTVKNADKIIVLHEGEIVEQGTHYELTQKRGMYYGLVKNQLEMGL